MIQKCKFNKQTDLQEHVPALAVDIAKAIESGVATNASAVEDFNFMDIEVAENASRVRDPFDALDYGVRLAESKTEFTSGTGNVTIAEPTSPTSPADPQ